MTGTPESRLAARMDLAARVGLKGFTKTAGDPSTPAVTPRAATLQALAARVGLKGFNRPVAAADQLIKVPPLEAGNTDRERAILALAEAKERPTQARHIAANTSLSAAEAQSLLAASPVGAAPEKRSGSNVSAAAATTDEARRKRDGVSAAAARRTNARYKARKASGE